MLNEEFIAGVLAGVENTLNEVIERVEDAEIQNRLCTLANQVEQVRLWVYPSAKTSEMCASETALECRSQSG